VELTSPEFAGGGPIPPRHSCEGEDVSPSLRWSGIQAGARSLAVIVEDPDAPGRTFTHWTAWGIPADAPGLAVGEAAPLEGRNDFGAVGYRGPCPPFGHGPHRYVFRLHALDAEPGVAAGGSRRALEASLEGHILETAELVGTYAR
jgi:Raf kinase inhibitor-like YbhB/YbcL family protein